jgi:hypothetical protein
VKTTRAESDFFKTSLRQSAYPPFCDLARNSPITVGDATRAKPMTSGARDKRIEFVTQQEALSASENNPAYAADFGRLVY